MEQLTANQAGAAALRGDPAARRREESALSHPRPILNDYILNDYACE